MRVQTADALPAGPVAVQLRFSRDGEVVFPATLEVTLNRTDVTAEFVTNPRGDRVDGIVPGTTRTATDTDRFTFTIP